jgi:hypothetical protein
MRWDLEVFRSHQLVKQCVVAQINGG